MAVAPSAPRAHSAQSSLGEPRARCQLRWSTAVHEAGHAIVAMELGLSVGGLELFATEGAGRALIEDSPHLAIIDRIAVCAAGIDATDLFRLEPPIKQG